MAGCHGVHSLATVDFGVDGGLGGSPPVSISTAGGQAGPPPPPPHWPAPASLHKGPCQELGGARAAPHSPRIPSTPRSPLVSSPKVWTVTPGCLGPFSPYAGPLPYSPLSPRRPVRTRVPSGLHGPPHLPTHTDRSRLPFSSCMTSDLRPCQSHPPRLLLFRLSSSIPGPRLPSGRPVLGPTLLPSWCNRSRTWLSSGPGGRAAVGGAAVTTCGPSANSFSLPSCFPTYKMKITAAVTCQDCCVIGGKTCVNSQASVHTASA